MYDCGVTIWNQGGDLPENRWSTLVGCQGSCPIGEGYDRFTWFPKKGNCKCCKSGVTSVREVSWSAFSGELNCVTCVQPSTTGYDFTNVIGTQTMSGFAPSGVECAAGYTGTVTYTPCTSAGDEYQVSGCQVLPSSIICTLLQVSCPFSSPRCTQVSPKRLVAFAEHSRMHQRV